MRNCRSLLQSNSNFRVTRLHCFGPRRRRSLSLSLGYLFVCQFIWWLSVCLTLDVGLSLGGRTGEGHPPHLPTVVQTRHFIQSDPVAGETIDNSLPKVNLFTFRIDPELSCLSHTHTYKVFSLQRNECMMSASGGAGEGVTTEFFVRREQISNPFSVAMNNYCAWCWILKHNEDSIHHRWHNRYAIQCLCDLGTGRADVTSCSHEMLSSAVHKLTAVAL